MRSNTSTSRPPGRKTIASDLPVPPALLGQSAAVRQSREVLERQASTAILLLADEGLDAPAIARYLHDRTRAAQPFVHVDCASPDADALDAELFGVRGRGATDLETLGAGAALLATRRGTLFLDNLADLPAGLQRRLARVLRDGEARVIGRDRVRLEAHVIAAAVPSVTADAADGRFRPDLLRRFGPSPVPIPSLRERPEDIRAIVTRVAAEMTATTGGEAPGFTPAALTMLAALPWSRNLEELRAMLARAFARLDGRLVRQEDLLPAAPIDGFVRRVSPAVTLREARRRFEREYIAAVLEQHEWRMSDAARTLGIERANLYRKTRELGIQRSAPGGRGHS